jgi:hypothetical protein
MGFFMNSAPHKLSKKHFKSIGYILFPFVLSAAYLALLEAYFKPQAASGVYFQALTSDDMMQTLPIQTLKDSPFFSLWFLHIQPPMLDIIRAVLAFFADTDSGAALLEYVDKGLYMVWIIIFSSLNALIFTWTKKLTRSVLFALFATFIWLLNPAPIKYATYFESSLLSSFLITWLIYELWRVLVDDGSAIRLALAASLSFLTRTVFQWYFLPIFIASILIMRIKRRDAILSISIFGVVVLFWCLKQFSLFHTVSTTTFSGYHKTGVIWYQPPKSQIHKYEKQIKVEYPAAAVKYGNQYNSEMTWRDNLIHSAIFSDLLKTNYKKCILEIMRSFRFNFSNYWLPSGGNMANVITDKLPWLFLYQWVFSGRRFICLIVVSGLFWCCTRGNLRKKNLIKVFGFILVLGYIFVISNLCNRLWWTEAYRIKFFLEPGFFVFIFSQIYIATKTLLSRKSLPERGV